MKRFFGWLGMVFKTLFAWALPAAQEKAAGGVKGVGTGLRIALHVLVVAAVLVGLHFLGRALKLETFITTGPFLRYNWLPILFLLLYLLGWLVVLLWRLLRTEDQGLVFPDIDEAWQEALAALAQANLRVADLPLFLILGQPEGEERNLFQASQLSLVVNQTPARPEAPIHVYASKDALYVTCPGASLMGKHSAILAGRESLGAAPVPVEGAAEESEEDLLSKTLQPGAMGGGVEKMRDIMARAEREGRRLSQLTRHERRQLRSLQRRDNPRGSLLNNPDTLELLSLRLRYLCKLIARDRYPYCPANGILVLLPFSGTDHQQDATDTGNILHRDLVAAREVLRVMCPTIVLLCDFETLPGFAEFIERFNQKERLQRVGHRCPLVPDFLHGNFGNGEQGRNPVATMMDSLAVWICNSVVPAWVYKKFQLEGKGGVADPAAATRHNSQLFLLANELRERQGQLSTVLTHGLATEPTDPPLIGGCYIAGTGKETATEQAFVAAVLRRLTDEQNVVSWAPETLEEEARLTRWTTTGWALLGIFATLAVAGAIYLIVKK